MVCELLYKILEYKMEIIILLLWLAGFPLSKKKKKKNRDWNMEFFGIKYTHNIIIFNIILKKKKS